MEHGSARVRYHLVQFFHFSVFELWVISGSCLVLHLLHARRVWRTLVVSMTTRRHCCSQIICQKSRHVFGRGPCAAMYRFTTPEPGISIYKHKQLRYYTVNQCTGSQPRSLGSPSTNTNNSGNTQSINVPIHNPGAWDLHLQTQTTPVIHCQSMYRFTTLEPGISI